MHSTFDLFNFNLNQLLVNSVIVYSYVHIAIPHLCWL